MISQEYSTQQGLNKPVMSVQYNLGADTGYQQMHCVGERHELALFD